MWHVDDGALHAFLDGESPAVDSRRADEVEAHLAVCDACAARLERARRYRSAARSILRGADTEVGSPPPFDEIVKRARVRAGTVPVRWWRSPRILTWAASLALALGTGWFARDLLVPGTGDGPAGTDAPQSVAATREGPAAGRPESKPEPMQAFGGEPTGPADRNDGAVAERQDAGREAASAGERVAAADAAPHPAAAGAAPDPAGVGAARKDSRGDTRPADVVDVARPPAQALDVAASALDAVVTTAAAEGPLPHSGLAEPQVALVQSTGPAAAPSGPDKPVAPLRRSGVPVRAVSGADSRALGPQEIGVAERLEAARRRPEPALAPAVPIAVDPSPPMGPPVSTAADPSSPVGRPPVPTAGEPPPPVGPTSGPPRASEPESSPGLLGRIVGFLLGSRADRPEDRGREEVKEAAAVRIVRGRVVSEDSAVIAEPVRVVLADDAGRVVRSATAVADGGFEFRDVAPGTYQLVALLNGFEFSPHRVVVEEDAGIIAIELRGRRLPR